MVPSGPQVYGRFGILERVRDQGAATQVNDAGVAERRPTLNRDGGIDALGKLVQLEMFRHWQLYCHWATRIDARLCVSQLQLSAQV